MATAQRYLFQNPGFLIVSHCRKQEVNQFGRNPESEVAPRSRSDDRGVVLYLEAFALYRPMGAAADSAPGGACQAFRPPTRAETLMPGQFICPVQIKIKGSRQALRLCGIMAPRSRSDDRGVVLYLEAFALYRPMGAASDSAPSSACQAFRPPTRAETLMPGQFICHRQI